MDNDEDIEVVIVADIGEDFSTHYPQQGYNSAVTSSLYGASMVRGAAPQAPTTWNSTPQLYGCGGGSVPVQVVHRSNAWLGCLSPEFVHSHPSLFSPNKNENDSTTTARLPIPVSGRPQAFSDRRVNSLQQRNVNTAPEFMPVAAEGCLGSEFPEQHHSSGNGSHGQWTDPMQHGPRSMAGSMGHPVGAKRPREANAELNDSTSSATEDRKPYHYRPQFPSASAGSKRTAPKDPAASAASRLYADSNRRREQQAAVAVMSQQAEMAGVTFRPAVDPHSAAIVSHSSHNHSAGEPAPVRRDVVTAALHWEEERLAKQQELQRKRDLELQAELTFKPKLSRISEKVATTEYFDPRAGTLKPVEERLLEKNRQSLALMEAKRMNPQLTNPAANGPTTGATSNRHPHNDLARPLLPTTLPASSIEEATRRLYQKSLEERQAERDILKAQAESQYRSECPFSPKLSHRTKTLVGDGIPVPASSYSRTSSAASTSAAASHSMSSILPPGSTGTSVHERLAAEAMQAKLKKQKQLEERDRSLKQQSQVGQYIGVYSHLLGALPHERSTKVDHSDLGTSLNESGIAQSRNLTPRKNKIVHGEGRTPCPEELNSTGDTPRYATPLKRQRDEKKEPTRTEGGNVAGTRPGGVEPGTGTGTTPGKRSTKEQQEHVNKLMEWTKKRDAEIERLRLQLQAESDRLDASTDDVPHASHSARRRTATTSASDTGTASASDVYQRQKEWTELRDLHLERKRLEAMAKEQEKVQTECTFKPDIGSNRYRTHSPSGGKALLQSNRNHNH
jgi:hypothetical protein